MARHTATANAETNTNWALSLSQRYSDRNASSLRNLFCQSRVFIELLFAAGFVVRNVPVPYSSNFKSRLGEGGARRGGGGGQDGYHPYLAIKTH